jgi:hypothetical protein
MDLEESLRGLVKILYQPSSGGIQENHKEISVRITRIPTDIRTEYLYSTSLERYHHLQKIESCSQYK